MCRRLRRQGFTIRAHLARLRALRAELGSASSREALRHASTVTGLLDWSRTVLADRHLVDVSSALTHELHLGRDDLRALTLPVDLLDLFPEWRRGSRAGFRPRALSATPRAAGAADPLPTLRVHLSPATGTAPLVLTLARDLLRRGDPALRIAVVVDPDADRLGVGRLARAIVGRSARLTFVTADFGTIFARDNALAATDRRGRAALIVPRALRTPVEPAAPPLDERATARGLGVRIVRSRLYWHGGNLLNDGVTVAIGADTIAENVTRLGLSRAEVVACFAAEQGRPVTVLGDPSRGQFDASRNRVTPSGQASFHIDLDVVLVGRVVPGTAPVAIVADPAAGAPFVSSATAVWSLQPPPHLTRRAAADLLARELRLARRQRTPALAGYRRTLADAGYRVVPVPEVRTRGWIENDVGLAGRELSYCNVVPGLHRGCPAVYYLPWGVRGLDGAAASAFAGAGVRPIALSNRSDLPALMMDRAAGLRCFVGG